MFRTMNDLKNQHEFRVFAIMNGTARRVIKTIAVSMKFPFVAVLQSGSQ